MKLLNYKTIQLTLEYPGQFHAAALGNPDNEPHANHGEEDCKEWINADFIEGQ